MSRGLKKKHKEKEMYMVATDNNNQDVYKNKVAVTENTIKT